MFFADPVAGFANVARALRPKGSFTFVCWQGWPETTGSDYYFPIPRRVKSAFCPPRVRAYRVAHASAPKVPSTRPIESSRPEAARVIPDLLARRSFVGVLTGTSR